MEDKIKEALKYAAASNKIEGNNLTKEELKQIKKEIEKTSKIIDKEKENGKNR